MIPPFQENVHYSQSASSKPNSEFTHVVENDEPARKPKKANSEHRKLQNRVASKNYREKRKQKLHYLERVVRGESKKHQPSSPSPKQPEAFIVPVTTDHATAETSVSSYQPPFESDDRYENSSSVAFTSSMSSPRTMVFSSPLYSSIHTHTTFGPSWDSPLYSPPPPPDIPWNMPSYSPGLDQAPRLTQHVDAYNLTPPPTHHMFDSSDTMYQPQLQQLSYSIDPNFGAFDSSGPWDGQTRAPIPPNVSLPTTSPSYYDDRYRWPS